MPVPTMRDPIVLAQVKKSAYTLGEQLRSRCFVDLSRDPASSVLLLSDARSGSTWVADLINQERAYRYMFEPFHPRVVKPAARPNMFQYLACDEDAPEFRQFTERVLNGQFRYPRVDRYNRQLVSRERLIKDVTANLFAGWIQSEFPSARIVLLLRHPFGVAVSKEATKYWTWPGVSELTRQPALVADFLEDYIDELTCEDDPLLEQVYMWAVLHYVPLHQLDPRAVHLAFYEHFCIDPAAELERVLAFLDGPDGKRRSIRGSLDTDTPSVMSRGDSAARSGRKPIDEWQESFTGPRLQRGREIRERFGLGSLYSGLMPDRDAATELLRTRV